MTEPRHIVFVKEGRQLYGAEMATVRLLRHLDPERIQASFLVLEYQAEPSDFLRAVRELDVEATAVHRPANLKRQLRTLAQSGEVDAIISIGYKCHILTWWSCRNGKAALFAILHGWVDTDLKLKAYNRVARFCLRQYDGVMTVARSVKVASKRTACIYNGVDAQRLEERADDPTGLSLPGDKPTILFVGRLEKEKGVFDLIRATARMDQIQLALVGTGPLQPELEQLAEDINCNAMFLGHVQNPAGLMREATALVLPSYTEGTPLVLLEAMALGTPVIASEVGGIPDMIKHEVNGLLVKPRYLNGLKSAIEHLLQNEPLQMQLAAGGKETIAEHFSEEAVAHRFSETVESWLHEHGS